MNKTGNKNNKDTKISNKLHYTPDLKGKWGNRKNKKEFKKIMAKRVRNKIKKG